MSKIPYAKFCELLWHVRLVKHPWKFLADAKGFAHGSLACPWYYHISTIMNPYEIVPDPVLRRRGMSVPTYLILVLTMALIFALLVA